MILALLTFLTGLAISAVAIYYSVLGLASIFSGAVLPIMVMGTILELSKLVAAWWLKANWSRAPVLLKSYMLIATLVLMIITSMGIFGFLSKAHSDQSLATGDVASQVAIYDEQIKIERENIANAQALIKQMDDAVNGIQANGSDREIKLRDGRTYTRSAAELALQTRRSQAKDRASLTGQIQEAQAKIVELQKQKAPIAAEQRKVEAEVGPIKYIAAFVYGDNPDKNLLEKAVTWVIITIVFVFDPLAILLLLASQMSFGWVKQDKETPPVETKVEPAVPHNFDDVNIELASIEKEPNIAQTEASIAEVAESESVSKNSVQIVEKIVEKEVPVEVIVEKIVDREVIKEVPVEVIVEKIIEKQVPVEIEKIVEVEKIVEKEVIKEVPVEVIVEKIVEKEIPVLSDEYFQNDKSTGLAQVIKEKQLQLTKKNQQIADKDTEIAVLRQQLSQTQKPILQTAAIQADNLGGQTNSGFGTSFPEAPSKGDTYLRVDYLPSKLYKWNGKKWMEVDKALHDSYAYDEEYIKHLIEQVNTGQYSIDDLSDLEQEEIKNYLSK